MRLIRIIITILLPLFFLVIGIVGSIYFVKLLFNDAKRVKIIGI
jgi:hypothetical protein